MKKKTKKILKLNAFIKNQFKEIEVMKNKMDKSQEISQKHRQELKNLDHQIQAEKIQAH